jgi:hypothetical protein
LALGLTPSEVDDMPARDVELMWRYWNEEPWGSWRDNIHAALIAAEVRRPNVKQGMKVRLDDFMLRHPEDREAELTAKRREANRNLYNALKAMAVRKKNG